MHSRSSSSISISNAANSFSRGRALSDDIVDQSGRIRSILQWQKEEDGSVLPVALHVVEEAQNGLLRLKMAKLERKSN